MLSPFVALKAKALRREIQTHGKLKLLVLDVSRNVVFFFYFSEVDIKGPLHHASRPIEEKFGRCVERTAKFSAI